MGNLNISGVAKACLNQHWLAVNQNAKIFLNKKETLNVVRKLFAISFRP